MGKFKTSIGGQAVIEGIAMRGPEKTCLAIRLPDGSIKTETTATKKNPYLHVPILRGIVALFLSLESGYRYLMQSTEISFPDMEEDAFDRWIKKHFGDSNKVVPAIAAVLAGFLSIALFVLLPTVITGILAKLLPFLIPVRTVIESLLKMSIFVVYIYFSSKLPDIRRVFQYHGAEHKTIFCYEDQKPLTVENVRTYGRFHPRCGTSFTVITLLISIFVFSFVPWTSTVLRVIYKLLCLPLIMGISYEFIRYAGAHDNFISRMFSAPGLWIQRLTVFEPDDGMIEVAIASLLEVVPEQPESGDAV